MRVLDVQGTADNILYYLRDRNMTQRRLAILCNVSDAAVHKWVTGIALPSLDNIVLLTSIFDCTMDNLIATKKG